MALSKQIVSFSLFAGILLSIVTSVNAQRRITYEQLANQQREQSIFFDHFTLPGLQNETVQFITTFRVDYNLLPFRKTNNPDSEYGFFSTASMSIEVFRDENAEARNKKKRRNDFSVEGMEPVAREYWRDTTYADNYAQTQSKNQFISGSLTTELKPGNYSYILQFTRGEEVDGQSSRKRFVKISPFNEKKKGEIVLIENTTGEDGSERLQLLNFGNNVYYGKDFYTLVDLPGHQAKDTYSLTINKVDISERDTTKRETIFSKDINSNDLRLNIKPTFGVDESSLYVDLEKSDNDLAFALIKIPNSTFQNAIYQIQLTRVGQKAPIAQRIFRSRWIEMPTSLLNIDIAIDMMRYIVDESTLKKLRDGSNSEKEKKFRAFWNEKDPTPKTEFNELMAEYYRRIDYAYEEFSTINVNGYNTDQGRIYIQYGPPKNIERKFPPGEPAVEIWNYGQRTFVFRAVSGFGEFELVSS